LRKITVPRDLSGLNDRDEGPCEIDREYIYRMSDARRSAPVN
jgi:hypothetical protein